MYRQNRLEGSEILSIFVTENKKNNNLKYKDDEEFRFYRFRRK